MLISAETISAVRPNQVLDASWVAEAAAHRPRQHTELPRPVLAAGRMVKDIDGCLATRCAVPCAHCFVPVTWLHSDMAAAASGRRSCSGLGKPG